MLNIIRSHLDRNLLGLRTCPVTKLRKHLGQIWALFLGILAVFLLLWCFTFYLFPIVCTIAFFILKTSFKAMSPYSGKDRRTCLRRCFKEDFKAANISTENISCEISKFVTITTILRPNHICTI